MLEDDRAHGALSVRRRLAPTMRLISR